MSPMNIELTGDDLRRMPSTLSAALVNWLQYQGLKTRPPSKPLYQSDTEQLPLTPVTPEERTQKLYFSSNHAHVRLSQLFDAGFTKTGMAVRVRLKQEVAKERGHHYVTKGLDISSKGTVIYNGQEFDKPSPLAKQVNGSAVNGWEYVEVMTGGGGFVWMSFVKLGETHRD